MKKAIALFLCSSVMLSTVGCSQLEQEHFDKLYVNRNMTGTAKITSEISYTVDADAFIKAMIAADTGVDENDPEFWDSIRFVLDENKKLNVKFSAEGVQDFDNMTSDMHVVASLNNITADCGNVYVRDNAIYMDKKILYTFGAVSHIQDTYDLSSYFETLDKLFGKKQYMRLALDEAGGTKVDMLALKDAQKEFYGRAKDVLKGFDSGCVSKITNGTRFELSSDKFAGVSRKFLSAVKQNKDDAADLVNDYIDFSFALSSELTGENAAYMASVIDGMKIAPDDVTKAADDILPAFNTPEYKMFTKLVKIDLTNDITSQNGVTTNYTVVNASAGKDGIVRIEAKETVEKAKEVTFAQIDQKDHVDYKDYIEALQDIDEPLYEADEDYTFDDFEFEE